MLPWESITFASILGSQPIVGVPPIPCKQGTIFSISAPRAAWMEDQEPPFSQIEVLEFCKLNDWVFDFPPPWKGGNLIEGEAWCLPLVGDTRDDWAVARLSSDIQVLYWTFMANQCCPV